MGNCVPYLKQWKGPSLRRKSSATTSSASSTTSQLPPPPTASGRRKSTAPNAKSVPPTTTAEFDLLSLVPLDRRPTQQQAAFDPLNFTSSFAPTDSSPPASASNPRHLPHRRKHRKANTTSLPSYRPSTPNPFDPIHPQLTIAVHNDIFPRVGMTDGAVSVSHVSKNGVSFFPHFSFNDEGKEGDGEEGEEVSAGGEEEEKSRISSTEMEDDISIRYTTPTMASNHIVRPLPSPSSLSVPQPSIGSGINSSEHSIVHSTITAPSNYRQKSLTSQSVSTAFQFPPVFSPKSAGELSGGDADASSSPLSGLPPHAAASPPSATSPLSHTLQSLAGFTRHEVPTAHGRASAGHVTTASVSVGPVYHPPTTNIHSPPPPSTNHLTLNTNAVALASQLFDDSELAAPSSTNQPSSAHTVSQSVHRQRSPRSALQRSIASLRAPHTTSSSTNHSPQSSIAINESTPPLHRLSSQPDPALTHSLSSSSSSPSTLHTPSHSLSIVRGTGVTAPRSPGTGGKWEGRSQRGRDEDEEVGEGEDREELSGMGGTDSKSREEGSRVRGVGIVKT